MFTIILSVATVLFIYPFLIYPAVLFLLARARRWEGGDSLPATPPAGPYPSVAMVICALNEEKIIGAKVENCLALNYPKDRLRIVIVSDGSTDRTAKMVRRYTGQGVELVEQPMRRGKIANLNRVIPRLREEVVVLSDANVIYHRDALRKLVDRFRDESVGCVSGRVILHDSSAALEGPTGNYYSLEWRLQAESSQLYSMVGADGAMYAFRRELFQRCPDDTIIEDFIIPMAIVRQGKRVVFEPGAIGWEKGAASLREEFRRKVRIAAGSVQGLVRGNAWPIHAPARFWFIFLSHKFMRWTSPLVGLVMLVIAALSAEQIASQVLLAGFAAMGAMALLRMLTGWGHPMVSAPFYFLFGQAALAWGLLKGISGQQTVLWAKADR
jgi:biofilm PGA synthesis N-glycosyltransferase PgaC